jgi:hypothetical protein
MKVDVLEKAMAYFTMVSRLSTPGRHDMQHVTFWSEPPTMEAEPSGMAEVSPTMPASRQTAYSSKAVAQQRGFSTLPDLRLAASRGTPATQEAIFLALRASLHGR